MLSSLLLSHIKTSSFLCPVVSLYWWWLLNLRKVMLPSVSPPSQNIRKELVLVIIGQVSRWLWWNREQILFLVPESKKYLYLIDIDPERRGYSKLWNIIQLSTLWPEKESREWLVYLFNPSQGEEMVEMEITVFLLFSWWTTPAACRGALEQIFQQLSPVLVISKVRGE